MRLFYGRLLAAGEHPAHALRHAKLAFRESGGSRGVAPLGAAGEPANGPGSASRLAVQNPYFWAPFIYVGAPPR